jgi:hypothetical protein
MTTTVVQPLRILVTGWRHWPATRTYVIEEALDAARGGVLPCARTPKDPTATLAFVSRPDWYNRPVIVRHGMCPYGGADLWADQWAVRYGHLADRHPAEKFHPQMRIAGPLRNSWMVEHGPKPDVCLAFPGPNSSGTWDCVRKAARHGIETVVIGFNDPDFKLTDADRRPIQWPPSNMEELKP